MAIMIGDLSRDLSKLVPQKTRQNSYWKSFSNMAEESTAHCKGLQKLENAKQLENDSSCLELQAECDFILEDITRVGFLNHEIMKTGFQVTHIWWTSRPMQIAPIRLISMHHGTVGQP